MADLARYVKRAGKTRGGREKTGPRPFSDLVGRAGRPRERGPEMEEWQWRRMLGAALPGVRLDGPEERGKKPRVQIRVGKDGVYIRVTYIYAYCIARIQYGTRLVPRLASGASRGRR